jgi:Dockerin type I domain
MGVLIGDVTADGIVNSTDVSQVQSQLHQPVTASNFRDDVKADGVINHNDVNMVKSKSGTDL